MPIFIVTSIHVEFLHVAKVDVFDIDEYDFIIHLSFQSCPIDIEYLEVIPVNVLDCSDEHVWLGYIEICKRSIFQFYFINLKDDCSVLANTSKYLDSMNILMSNIMWVICAHSM